MPGILKNVTVYFTGGCCCAARALTRSVDNFTNVLCNIFHSS